MSDGGEIERVLRALGQVEAPPGLERGILRRIEGRAAGKTRWAPGRASALAVAAAAAAIGLGIWQVRVPGGDGSLTDTDPNAAEAWVSSPASSGHPKLLLPHPSAWKPQPAAVSLIKQHKVDPAPGRELLRASATSMPDAAFPAPEIPLTDQERLLLRLARRPSEGTIAMFDTAVREERAAVAAEEFEEFFRLTQRTQPAEQQEMEHEALPIKR